MIDHRALLAEHLEVDVDVVEQVGDRVGAGLHLFDHLAARFDLRDLRVGIADAAEQVLDLGAQVGDIRAVVGDELQVRLAAAADLVDAFDFGLDRLDEAFALGNRLELHLDAFGGAGQVGEPAFEGGDLLLGERQLRAALLELLDHGLGALQLIFGGLGLRHRVALPCLDPRQLGEELVLDPAARSGRR